MIARAAVFLTILVIPALPTFADDAEPKKPPFTISKETTRLTEPLTGLLIYSLGPDGEDDGGVGPFTAPEVEFDATENDDVGARLN